MNKPQRGFTLVEMIVAMVIMGILAGILVVFFRPAMQNYFDASRRAALSDAADRAMRKLTRDVRASVPNSVRTHGGQCLEMVPTSAGGRYRTAPDINKAKSLAVEPGRAVTEFDALTDVSAAASDWIVIGNQNPDDVYIGSNRAAIASVDAPPIAGIGVKRIKLAGSGMNVPAGYDGARFVIVPAAQGPVSYVCKDRTLYRVSGYAFANPGSCPSVAADSAIVAKNVSACSFAYNPNPGATQESGYVEADITLQEANEFVRLVFGVHVDNLP
ncbi:PulJ/GspJ family protein [Pseudoduganella sp. HUAS MS19]